MFFILSQASVVGSKTPGLKFVYSRFGSFGSFLGLSSTIHLKASQ